MPIDIWLRGPLKDWAEDLLSERALRNSDIFDVDMVRRIWKQHSSEQGNWRDHLWIILMYQGWLKNA